MRVLVTGGAGFVGASLATGLTARHEGWHVVALDNLHRRGSELKLPRLREAGVEFVHGDVREPRDLTAVGPFDALVECSAEPSVLGGLDGDLDYVVKTNLLGAYHCLEACRRHDAQFVFCSSSRVYPVAHLRGLVLEETPSRFSIADAQELPGVSAEGISEAFPLDGARTFYGTTKLAAEQLAEEYAASFGLRTVIDRFGVLAGPWQLGKVDQGFVTYWALAHHFGTALQYIGFGGSGKQVRDVLHVNDAVELIDLQLTDPALFAGETFNVGGGSAVSTSLLELTELCASITGRTTSVTASDAERPGDVPLYITDSRRVQARSGWRPAQDLPRIVGDIHRWIADNRAALEALQP